MSYTDIQVCEELADAKYVMRPCEDGRYTLRKLSNNEFIAVVDDVAEAKDAIENLYRDSVYLSVRVAGEDDT